MFILDSHCDTPTQILRNRDILKDNEYAQVDLPKIIRGGVNGAFFALYIPAIMDSDYSSAFDYSIKLLDCVKELVSNNSDKMAIVTDSTQAFKAKADGLFSVFLGLENGSPIGESLDRISFFYEQGVRYITLCHSQDNQICDSCATEIKRWGGLSPFGKEVIAEMNRIGMTIDVSHVSDASFYDVLKVSKSPVVATHSCCRALAGHPRNMTDDMIKALAAVGGVIQINFYPAFLDDSFNRMMQESGLSDERSLAALPRPSYKRIADHIDHVVGLVGVEHVGLGSDFDGIDVTPEGLDDISMMPVLIDELGLRGYSDKDIRKIAGENFLRIIG